MASQYKHGHDVLLRAGYIFAGRILHHIASHCYGNLWCSPLTKSLWERNSPYLWKLFQRRDSFYVGKLQPKYTTWVDTFVADHPNYPNEKAQLTSSLTNSQHVVENFESWGFTANPEVDDATYLVGFLVYWFCGQIFVGASTSIRQRFFMAVEMAKGKQYSLVVPFLALAYRVLEEFQATSEEVKRTYAPWSLVMGWLAMHFPWTHNKFMLWTRCNLSFVSCIAPFSKAESDNRSWFFWYLNKIPMCPYCFTEDPT